jgi:chorismate synthase
MTNMLDYKENGNYGDRGGKRERDKVNISSGLQHGRRGTW